MTNRQAKQEYRVGVGASSIMMIFIILSLTTLGVLSFASARATLNLTTRRQAQVTAYYQAEAQAQALLARVDAALLAAQEDAETYEDTVLALSEMDAAISVSKKDLTISMELPIGEAQALQIKLSANGPEGAPRYTVLSYVVVNVGQWTPETHYDVPTADTLPEEVVTLIDEA